MALRDGLTQIARWVAAVMLVSATATAAPPKRKPRPPRETPAQIEARKRAEAEEAQRRTKEEEERRAKEEEEARKRAELLAAEAAAYEAAQRSMAETKADITRAERAIADDKADRVSGIVPLPNVSYAPETALALGGYLMYFRHLGDPDETRPSNVELNASVTTKKQLFTELGTSLWLAHDAFNVQAGFQFDIFPNTYFGVGKSTTLDRAEDFNARIFGGDLTLLARVVKNLYAGVRGLVDSHEIVETEPGGELATGLVPGSKGGVTLQAGPALFFDTRDNIYATQKGVSIDLAYQHSNRSIASDFAFGFVRTDVRGFLPLGRGHVLGAQVVAQVSHGTTPFYLLPKVGGDPLRGIFQGRFRDNHMAEAQVEWRFPIFGRFGGTFFAGAGQVARSMGDFAPSDVVTAAGGGLRYAIAPSERLNLRLDVAYAGEGSQYYLNVGEAF